MIDRESPIPIYYQLKQLIKHRIEEGSLGPGDRLPTEQELCERHNISRTPIRQALLDLVQEGYIYRRPGQGTFVARRGAPSEERQITLRFLAYDVGWIGLMERAVHLWNEAHPRQEVRLAVTMPPQAEFDQNLLAAVGRGAAPDLVSLDYVWMARYARMGFLSVLNELAPDFYERLSVNLEAPVLHNNRLDGNLYALPVQADITGLWYRRDWFEAEGLEPPRTWDDWLTLLAHFDREEVKARWGHRDTVSFPVSTYTGEPTLNVLLPLVWGAGGAVLGDEGQQVTLASSSTRTALSFLREIVWERGYLPADIRESRWWASPRRLARGEVPMTLGGTYEWPVISEDSGWETEEEMARHLGFVAAPTPTPDAVPVVSLGGTSWAVLRQSEHYDLVLELLRIVVEPEVIQPFCEQELQISTLVPVNQRLVQGDHPWMKKIVPLLSLARPRPMIAEYIQVSRFVQQMFERILCEGAPIDAVVERTAQTLELLLGEQAR